MYTLLSTIIIWNVECQVCVEGKNTFCYSTVVHNTRVFTHDANLKNVGCKNLKKGTFSLLHPQIYKNL